MPRGKKMNLAQRREAAEKLAAGVARREVAEILGVTKRSIERLCADAGFLQEVERAGRRQELAGHYAAKKMALRQHVPEPPHPDAVREERQLMADAAGAVRREMMARERRAVTPEGEILEWVLATAPGSEVEYLDRRDAEHGVVSDHARRRYEGRMCAPQVRILTF